MSRFSTPTLLQFLFDAGTERYARDTAPALAPLTADFIMYAAPSPADLALDLGTGTGSAARSLAPHVRRVVGVDISAASLRVALTLQTHPPTPSSTSPLNPLSNPVGEGTYPISSLNPPLHFRWRGGQGVRLDYIRADLHRLPFRAGAFTLVIASFGLNATDPGRALRAIRRVIAPGGRFVIQEWGPEDPFSRALDDLLAEYAIEDPAEPLARLRAWMDDTPPLWSDHLQDVDDYREWLGEAGFTVEEAAENAPLTIRLTGEQYLAFWLARTDRFEEVRAMDEAAQRAFYAAARERLAAFALPDGRLAWEPVVFRIRAAR